MISPPVFCDNVNMRRVLYMRDGWKLPSFLTWAVVLLAVHGAFAASTIPWRDDFETNLTGGAINGINGWKSSGATVIVAQTNTPYRAGTNACYVPFFQLLTNEFTGAAASIVWTDMYIKPELRAVSTAALLDENCSSQFYFNSNGYAVVANGPLTNWVVCSNTPAGAPATPVAAGSWIRISVFQDYTNHTWALLINDQLVGQNIGFVKTNQTGLTSFSLTGSSYVDNAWVNATLPALTNNNGNASLVGDHNGDSVADAWALYYFGTSTNTTGSLAANGDADGDGRTNLEEFRDGTDPMNPSSVLGGGSVYWNLPYLENFEAMALGSVNGRHGLTAAPPLSMLAQSSVYYQGARAMAVDTGMLDLAINDNTATNVWSDMYVRVGILSTAPSPPLRTNALSAFYVNGSGYIVAYDGTVQSWITLTNCYTNGIFTSQRVTAINPTNWFRLIIHQDFSLTNWSVWKAESVTNEMATNIALNLGFYTNISTRFTGLSISNTTPSASTYAGYIDNVIISSNKPDVIDFDGDGMPDNWEAIYSAGPTNLMPAVDADGDGVNNLGEYLAGTDPLTGSDYFRVTTMDLANGNDVMLNIRVGTNRNFSVYSTDELTGTKTLRGSGTTAFWQQNITWVDSGAVSACPTLHRFYQVVAESGGMTLTNNQEWAMYAQQRAAGLWSMAGVPVDFETDGQNNLTNELGTQLMRGLLKGPKTTADLVYVLSGTTSNFVKHWVTAGGQWWAEGPGGDEATNTTISAMNGLWVQRKDSTTTNTVFTGKVRTTGTLTVNITTNWNFISWPFKTARAESAGAGGSDVGWGFKKCGGIGSTNAVAADSIYIVQGNSWKRYYLLDGFATPAVNGRWWNYSRGGYAGTNLTLEAGQGFYYYHRGTGFTWTNSYGP